MSRADLAFWDVAMNMPISMDGVNDGMWALILITLLVVIFLANAVTPRYRSDRSDRYPPYHRPPNYPPWI